jgi:hypothetical protein
MSEKNGIAQINQPVEVTWNNRRVRTKENEKGEMFYFLEVEIDEETWGWMKTVPRAAMGDMIFWVTEIGLVPEKKPRSKKPPKTPSGPYNHFWSRLLYIDQFQHCPGVKEVIQAVIDANPTIMEKPIKGRAHEALRRLFKVDHLSTVSPDQAIKMFPSGNASSMVATARDWVEKHPPQQG